MSIPGEVIRRPSEAGSNPIARSRRSPSNQNQGETTMRFMVLVKGNKDSEAGVLPDQKVLGEMGKFREEALEWLKRAPFQEGEVEIRQVFETADFAASDPTGELMKKEEQLRKSIEA